LNKTLGHEKLFLLLRLSIKVLKNFDYLNFLSVEFLRKNKRNFLTKTMSSICKHHFGNYFETYINQILGDQTVRKMISEVWPRRRRRKIGSVNEDSLKFETIIDEGGDHHIVIDHKGNQYNSKNTLQTNIVVDNLCQSYCLAFWFNIILSKRCRKRNQMEIIELIKKIFSNEKFISLLNEELIKEKANKHLWSIYTKLESGEYVKTGKYVKMDIDIIRKNIFKTLKIWKEYGYKEYMYKKKKFVPE